MPLQMYLSKFYLRPYQCSWANKALLVQLITYCIESCAAFRSNEPVYLLNLLCSAVYNIHNFSDFLIGNREMQRGWAEEHYKSPFLKICRDTQIKRGIQCILVNSSLIQSLTKVIKLLSIAEA